MYLTKDQLTATLRHAWKHSRRDHLMLLLGAQHGLRRTEIAQLTLADVSGGKLTVARLKGSETTTHPLMSNDNILFDEILALRYYLEERATNAESLFGVTGWRVSQIAQEHMLAAGVPKELAHAHQLKHACCSYLIRQGIGVEYVRVYVGHKDVKSTIVYLNISQEEASAKAQLAFSNSPKVAAAPSNAAGEK